MRKPRLRLDVGLATLLLAVLLALFAIQLNASQNRARDVTAQRFRERAAVTATLTRSVFASAVSSAMSDTARRYGAARVDARTMASAATEGHLAYVMLLDADGRIIAASPGTPASVRHAAALKPPEVSAVLAGQPFWVSGVLRPAAHIAVFQFAQALQTRQGRRVLVTGVVPSAISGFIGGYLSASLGSSRGRAYVLDGRGMIVASSRRDAPSGTQLGDRRLLAAIARGNEGPVGDGREFASATVGDSAWRVVLVKPSDELFASANAVRWVPWLLFAAFALAGVVAIVLLRGLWRGGNRLAETNEQLNGVNASLESRLADLRRSEAGLAEAQAIAGVGSWEWDVAVDEVSWSRELYNIFGVGEHEFAVSFKSYLALVHPGDRDRVAGVIEEALATREKVEFTERIVRPDGDIRILQSRANPISLEDGTVTRLVGVCRDITESKRAEQEVRDSEERFRLLVDGVYDYAIIMLDADGRIATWNAGAERINGYTAEETLGAHVSIFYTPNDIAAGKAAHELEVALRDGRFEEEGWRLRKDGSRFWANVVITALRNADGTPRGFSKVTRDITERKRAEDRLRHDATHDRLTGLPNRTLVLDRAGQALTHMRHHPGYRCGVLFLDVDRFKLVNDSYSHAVGDELLVALARRLETTLRAGDTLARTGGDEFVVLLADMGGEDGALKVASRIHDELEAPFKLAEHEVFISASIGISTSQPGMTAEELIRNADIAMYDAKRLGSGRAATFDEGMHHRVISRLEIETDLRAALEDGRVRVFYQPIIDIRSGRLNGFEALARWPTEQRAIRPHEFIPVAEDSGLIAPLGRFVLTEACTRVNEWRKRGLIDQQVTISVNVSGRQFDEGSIVADVHDALEHSGLPPQALKLELTEGAIVNEPERLHAALAELDGLGVRAHIDDFGTGYSPLTVLRNFPGEALKIDRSFIASMHEDINDATLVRGVIGLAHDLRLHATAEGVENSAQLEELRRMGCDYAQGYLFSKPLDADAAESFIDAWEPQCALSPGALSAVR